MKFTSFCLINEGGFRMLSSKKTTQYLFYAYLILLTWCILFKFETRLEYIGFFRNARGINWIPFSEPLVVNGKIVLAEMVFNLLFFVPFGICLPMIREKWQYWKVVILGFLLSLLYESLQFALAIGMSDVTDLLLNTLGVCVGLLIYQLFLKILASQTRTWINLLGIVFVGLPLIVLIVVTIFGM